MMTLYKATVLQEDKNPAVMLREIQVIFLARDMDEAEDFAAQFTGFNLAGTGMVVNIVQEQGADTE